MTNQHSTYMITLFVIAGTILSGEVVEAITEVVQDEDVITCIHMDTTALLPPVITTIEYDDCLTYLVEYPDVCINNAQMPEVVHLAQHKTDFKSVE